MSFLLIQACTVIFIALEIMVPTVAIKKTSNVDGFMLENKRTRTRQDYVLQRDSNDGDMEDGVTYLTESRELEANPEELPALIVDYANMIRNDIILLDNSVETQTRKRGNVKLHKQRGVQIDVSCMCEHENRETVVLGADYVPQVIETLICNKNLCPKDYRCLQRLHDVTILKRREQEDVQRELPRDLGRHWITLKKSVIVGCYCSKNYTDHY